MNPAIAYAGDKFVVESPAVSAGELELEAGLVALSDHNPDINNTRSWKLGVEYGFNHYWSSELSAGYQKAPNNTGKQIQYYEWENKLRLNEPGRDWADWAMIVEYSVSADPGSKNAIELRPLMQKRFTSTQLTMNFGFERDPAEYGNNHWQLSYAWQYRWLGTPADDIALEGYGQVGNAGHWSSRSQQSHLIGPALVGKLGVDDDGGLEYRVGLYVGLTHASPDRAFMAYFEYEL